MFTVVLPNGPSALPSASFAAPQFAFTWRAARLSAISASLCGPDGDPVAAAGAVSPVPVAADDPFGDAPLAAVSPPAEEESPEPFGPLVDPELGGVDVVLDDESHFGAPSSSDFAV